MKRHLQCGEQQVSSTNVTKYCACHEKWLASLILMTYQTSFTMRRATRLTLQPHQILRLPRKMTCIIDPMMTCQTSCTMRRATGLTLQPHQILRLPRQIAFQNLREICRKQLKRHLEWRTIRPWSANDPNMKLQNWTRPFAGLSFLPSATHFVVKITTFRAPAIYPNFTEYCACHEKWHCNITKCCACHEKWHCNITKYCACHEKWHCNITKCCACHAKWLAWLIFVTYETSRSNRTHPPTSAITAPATQNSPARSPRLLFALRRRILYWKLQHFALRLSTQISPNTVPATKSDTPTSPNAVPATKSDTATSPNIVPATKSDTATVPSIAPATKSDTELLLNWTVTWLHSYFTALMLYWTVTWLELLLYRTILSCYFTELLLDWTVTWLSCYLTELLLYWTVTLLNCYLTELLLCWAVTLLSCYFTELLLDWAVTLLSCYFTELLLYWAVNTELLLYWAVT